MPEILGLQFESRAPITAYIDSPGGSVGAAQQLAALLKAPDQNSDRCRILTVATALAASAAADLLVDGDYALAYPNSKVHFHGTRHFWEPTLPTKMHDGSHRISGQPMSRRRPIRLIVARTASHSGTLRAPRRLSSTRSLPRFAQRHPANRLRSSRLLRNSRLDSGNWLPSRRIGATERCSARCSSANSGKKSRNHPKSNCTPSLSAFFGFDSTGR